MDYSITDTLEYVVFLTRRIKKGNIPKAILVVLMELGFQAGLDGFGYLRHAIFLKFRVSDLRMNTIYREVGRLGQEQSEIRQVEYAIRNAIEAAWAVRDKEKWHHFFSGEQAWDEYKPANGVFISTLGCVMELWCDCEREVSYVQR